MTDSSPFDQYEDAPHEEKDADHEVEDDEDDPFSHVPQAHSQSSAPGLEATHPAVDEETPLSVWEKQRGEILRERQAKADKEKAAQVQAAKEEIEKFYADQQTKLEKTKKINRADEKNYRTETAAVFANGTKWEKVNRIVNTGPKHGEKPGTSRVERYRKLLIQLKGQKDKGADKAKKAAA